VDNTKSIYKSGKMALDEEDWASWNFLQWFVKEQIEEENLASLYWIKLKL
jgi:ferritin